METSQIEKLSALLDGEVSCSDGKRLLDAVGTDSALKAKLSRYQSYSACLRGEPIDIDHGQLFNTICQRLADEPVLLAPNALALKQPLQSWRKLLSGGAIAAGVAAVVILGANNLFPGHQSAELVAGNDVQSQVLISSTAVLAKTPTAMPVSADTKDLNPYLQEHENLLSGSGLGTGLPLATMVGYDGF